MIEASGHGRDLGDVEAPECLPERGPLPEHDRPAEADLEHAEGERLEQRGLVVGAGTPDLVVVSGEGGIAGAGPEAAWLPVLTDDHVAAHPAASRLSRRRGLRHHTITPSRDRAQLAPVPRAS
jgi:hypothetical protein